MKKVALLEDEKKYWEDLASSTKKISAKVASQVDKIVNDAIKQLNDTNELGEDGVDVVQVSDSLLIFGLQSGSRSNIDTQAVNKMTEEVQLLRQAFAQ